MLKGLKNSLPRTQDVTAGAATITINHETTFRVHLLMDDDFACAAERKTGSEKRHGKPFVLTCLVVALSQ